MVHGVYRVNSNSNSNPTYVERALENGNKILKVATNNPFLEAMKETYGRIFKGENIFYSYAAGANKLVDTMVDNAKTNVEVLTNPPILSIFNAIA